MLSTKQIEDMPSKDFDTVLEALDMKCDACPIIDYCNNLDETPPCFQPRLEKMTVGQFVSAIDYWETRGEII